MNEILNQPPTEYLNTRLQNDQLLLDTIKARLPELEHWAGLFQSLYEDGIYRFYHHSFKVYLLQDCTVGGVEIFRGIGKTIDKKLCQWFEEIVAAGTGLEWKIEHNENWMVHTRPIAEAFFHTKYFLEMMTRYGREMNTAPTMLPAGWAAILELYNQR